MALIWAIRNVLPTPNLRTRASRLIFSTQRDFASSVRSNSCLFHETAYLLETAAGIGLPSVAQRAPVYFKYSQHNLRSTKDSKSLITLVIEFWP